MDDMEMLEVERDWIGDFQIGKRMFELDILRRLIAMDEMNLFFVGVVGIY